MKMKDILEKAKTVGVEKPDGMDKLGLIRAIQVKEGNFPCYATATEGNCDQEACLWSDDCMEDSSAVELHV
jgi:hypothetical protein